MKIILILLLFAPALAFGQEPTKDERQALRQELVAGYSRIIAKHYSHLNGMKAGIDDDKLRGWADGRGVTIYVEHSFFGRHEFAAGDVGREVSRWIEEHEEELAAAKVYRVGLRGEAYRGYRRHYQPASWFLCEKINNKDYAWHPRF